MSEHHLWGGSSVNRSRLRRNAAVSATVGAGLFVAIAGSPALAAPTPASSGSFTANGSATLARLDVAVPANALFPGGSGFLSLVNAQHAVNSDEDQASKARAQFIAGEALGQSAPDFPKNSVTQVAPPDNAEPATSELLSIPQNPLLWGKVLPASAHARWNNDIACPTGPVEIASAEAKVAELHALSTEGAAALPIALPGADALPIPAGVTLVDLPRVLASATNAGLVEVEGQDGLGVASTATIDVVDLTLFKGTPAQTRIQVVSQPKLTATAAGTEGKSKVEYEAPVLKVTDPQGTVHQIDAPGESYTIGASSLPAIPGGLQGALTPLGAAVPAGLPLALPAVPDLSNAYLAKISLGVLDKVIEDANTAQGRLTMLRLELLASDGENPLATLALGELQAQATVADGGLTCGSPSVLPTESEGPGNGGGPETLPVTGSDVTLLVAGGGLLLLLGRFAMVATARRQH
jgi:hypothetical protein